MPLPFSAAGVSTTLAPRKRISRRRSTLKFSAMDDDQRIAVLRAHHGEADAGVAAGRLDDGLPGAERAAALGRLDDAERQAVLDRAHRVEGLELGVELHRLGRERA